MSEENIVPEGETSAGETQVELSPVEQKALEMGWRPKDEFEGDEADFIDAKEFVSRRPLFDKIAAQNKQLKATRDALEAFKGHYTKVKETEFQNALKTLKAEKKQALADGDVDKFYAIEEQVEAIEEEKNSFVQEQRSIQLDAPQVHPDLQSWMSNNSWYENQPHMRVFADQIGERYAGEVRARRMTPNDVLKEIEKEVRAEFPNKFRNPNKDRPSAVEGSSRSPAKTGASKDPDLSDVEKNIMNTLVRGGHITKEKYLADLKAVKGL